MKRASSYLQLPAREFGHTSRIMAGRDAFAVLTTPVGELQFQCRLAIPSTEHVSALSLFHVNPRRQPNEPCQDCETHASIINSHTMPSWFSTNKQLRGHYLLLLLLSVLVTGIVLMASMHRVSTVADQHPQSTTPSSTPLDTNGPNVRSRVPS